MESETTKDTIIEVGSRLMLEKGYNNTGLQEVLKEARVPKGSFYHYFGCKEDFGLEIADRYARESNDFLALHLDNRDLPPLDRLRNFFQAAADRYDAEGCWGGCMMGNLGQEMSDQSPVFRKRVQTLFEGWRAHFADNLKQAAERGDIRKDLNLEETADFILDSWEGAILRMKVTKTIKPLERFMRLIFDKVLAP